VWDPRHRAERTPKYDERRSFEYILCLREMQLYEIFVFRMQRIFSFDFASSNYLRGRCSKRPYLAFEKGRGRLTTDNGPVTFRMVSGFVETCREACSTLDLSISTFSTSVAYTIDLKCSCKKSPIDLSWRNGQAMAIEPARPIHLFGQR
jgi:hypothetical protein